MSWIDEKIENFSGKFLQPKRGGLPVQCPAHGYIGVVSLGGELYCPTCHVWIPGMPEGEAASALGKKQLALQARLARKAHRVNQQMQREARKQKRLNDLQKRAEKIAAKTGMSLESVLRTLNLTPAQERALEAGRAQDG